MINLDTIRRLVRNAIAPLEARLAGIARRGVLADLDNTTKVASGSFSVTDDQTDTIDGVEFISPPGISYRPPKGAEAILLALGGRGAVRVAFPYVRGQRLTGDDIKVDELAIYVGRKGQVIHLKDDGSVVVSSAKVGDAGGSITLKANGDVVVVPSATGRVLLGDAAATNLVALANKVKARLDGLKLAIGTTWVPVAMDGGAALKAALADWLAESNDVAAENVYGKG